MEVAQVPINRWVDKEAVVYVYNRILLGHKYEWNLITCNNMRGPGEYYAQWNKLDKGKYHMISLICEI